MQLRVFLFIVFSALLILSGCSEIKNNITAPSAPTVHADGILNSRSPNFHGKLISNNAQGIASCQKCHAADFSGGTTNASCMSCHEHDAAVPSFHGKQVKDAGWNYDVCKGCHGADFGGGAANSSCLTCHTEEDGPYACNTCHGDFNDPAKVAPPRDLSGSTDSTSAGVGAHDTHLFGVVLTKAVKCVNCHIVPESFDAEGHIDALNNGAELVFGDTLNQYAASTPAYDRASATCSNIYCHGNWQFKKADRPITAQFAYTDTIMVGNNRPVVWNHVGVGEAECGTCHNLPPTGHLPATRETCGNCHTGIVDNTGHIINPQKHINGMPNVFGN